MGYSCTKKAGDALDKVMRAAGHEFSNTWHNANQVMVFYERGREHADGRITNGAHISCDKAGRVGAGDFAKPCGTIGISADGIICRWPHASKAMRAAIKDHNATQKAFSAGHMFVIA